MFIIVKYKCVWNEQRGGRKKQNRARDNILSSIYFVYGKVPYLLRKIYILLMQYCHCVSANGTWCVMTEEYVRTRCRYIADRNIPTTVNIYKDSMLDVSNILTACSFFFYPMLLVIFDVICLINLKFICLFPIRTMDPFIQLH